MAAPHVSGAVAAFLSVQRELIGNPEEIKRIKGIGWQARPEQPDDTFRPTDPFGPEL